MTKFLNEFYALADPGYRAFQSRLIPELDPETIRGVRFPAMRAFVKKYKGTKEAEAFLDALPHGTYDENTLHALFLNEIREPETLYRRLDAFLPYVDNWATCDALAPKAVKKDLNAARRYADRCQKSDRPFTVRFGIGLDMKFFLGDAFLPAYAKQIAAIRTGEYYVEMMIAWYFATALAKQRDAALPFFTEERLSPPVRKKAIRKALESFRVSAEDKALLRSLH